MKFRAGHEGAAARPEQPKRRVAIHVAVIRRVRPGCEAEFMEALREFFRASFEYENVLGASMIVPAPGDDPREYGILRTFANAAQRDAFYASPLFREWDKRARELTVGEPLKRELTGLEAWFRNPEGSQPPVWKMALLTFIAVWPVSMLVPAIVLPVIGSILHPVLVAGVIALGIVVILTWGAMPLLTKLTRSWLQPSSNSIPNPIYES